MLSIFAILVQNSPIVMEMFRNYFSNLYGKDQNLLDEQISWDFAANILKLISETDFQEVRKKVKFKRN